MPVDTYRPSGTAWWTAMVWLLATGWVVGAGLDGGPPAVLRAAPLGALVAVVGALAFRHPRVEVDDEAVRLVNPLRTVQVPWAALIDVRTRFALTLVTPAAQYRAFAAPGPSARQVAASGRQTLDGVPRSAYDGAGSVAIGDLPVAPSGVAARLVRRRWEALVEAGAVPLGEADSTPATTVWNVPGLAALAATCAATVLVVLL